MGAFTVVVAALAGALLARPIIDLVAESNYHAKAAALADLQGKLWSHRGFRVDIEEDADRARWLLAADVRKIVTALPRDEVLQRQFGERVGALEDIGGFRIRADALIEYLGK